MSPISPQLAKAASEALGLPAAAADPVPPLPEMTMEERRKVLAYLEVSRASERGA